jgi:iron(III) transport system substrate-binding protein
MFKLLLPLSIILVVGLPFLLRDSDGGGFSADDRVVIISPHNESIRHEFTRAFQDWYEAQTGRSVRIDWRVIGGTSEITRFLQSGYLNGFRNYWTQNLERRWSMEVENAFSNPAHDSPTGTTAEGISAEARAAFLNSDISVGVDLFFGGGSFDFIVQANAGNLVSSRIFQTHPDWFNEEVIPSTFSGEPFYDKEGRWFGTALSAFGIIFNRDALARVGFDDIPKQWEDLADPRLFANVGLADPSKSGSSNKAFEMILQQQMQQLEQTLIAEGLEGEALSQQVREQGWLRGLGLIQRISANARYFTDSASKPSIDVSQGDCVAGMSIDFYGRFQEETLVRRGGGNRFGYITPVGGSTVSVDPIGILRGAPNHEVAERFVEFVLSPEGQSLWDLRVGTANGPRRYALRRQPVRREFYEEPLNSLRSDPDVLPYLDAESFIYRAEWTARLFSPLRFIIKTAFIDVHSDLVDAWGAIIEAQNEGRHADAEAAMAILGDLSIVDYATASGRIRDTLRDQNKLLEVHLTNELTRHFREQYRRAASVARGDSSER